MTDEVERSMAAMRQRLKEAIEATWWQTMTGQKPAQPFIDADYRVLPERQPRPAPPKGEV